MDGAVTASAYNLNGQLKDLEMRRITEGTSFYFIGEVGISGTEILVFDIERRPERPAVEVLGAVQAGVFRGLMAATLKKKAFRA